MILFTPWNNNNNYGSIEDPKNEDPKTRRPKTYKNEDPENEDPYENTKTNVTVPLRNEFNQNKETETSKNERIPKTNRWSMEYCNT